MLDSICGEKRVDPIFWEQYARELKDDARELPRALRLLQRALRYRRREASIYHALGSVRWEQRCFADAHCNCTVLPPALTTKMRGWLARGSSHRAI